MPESEFELHTNFINLQNAEMWLKSCMNQIIRIIIKFFTDSIYKYDGQW